MRVAAEQPVSAAPPANDAFTNRSPIVGTNRVYGSNVEATKEAGEADHAGHPGGRSIWWEWTAPASGSLIVEVGGWFFEPLLAVYFGTNVANLSLIADNADSEGYVTGEARFNVLQNHTYSIAVDGVGRDSGNVTLNLNLRVGTFITSSEPREDFWVSDSPVNVVLATDDRVYIGGEFRYLRQNKGSGILVDATSNEPELPFPEANGEVVAVAADGLGGWYITGGFSVVGNFGRSNFAHVRADKTVNPTWNPVGSNFWPGSEHFYITSLAADRTNVYVAGDLDAFATLSPFLVALNATDGTVTRWYPTPDGEITHIFVSEGVIYVSGGFTQIGSHMRNGLAAIDTASGQVLPWNPNPDGSASVYAASCDSVFVAGAFSFIGGDARRNLASLDPVTGQAMNFSIDSDSQYFGPLVLANDILYVYGAFTMFAGRPRTNLAAIDIKTGLVTSWRPSLASDAGIVAMALANNTVYVAGSLLAAFDAITGAERPLEVELNVEATGWVKALAGQGSKIYAAGFLSPNVKPRSYLASLDAATGLPTDWNPNLNGFVDDFVVRNNMLFVAGGFTEVGGQLRNGLAAIDATTGMVLPWNPDCSGAVYALEIFGNTLYIGGSFSSVGSQARNNLAALDMATGDVLPWNPNPDRYVEHIAGVANTVYVAGDFRQVGGQQRNYLAALDANTGIATAWSPNLSGHLGSTPYVDVLRIADYAYVGGDGLVGFGLTSGQEAWRLWTPEGVDPFVYDIAFAREGIYVGGSYHLGGYLALHRWSSGSRLAWHPSLDFHGSIHSLALVEPALYAGGWFNSINGKYRPNLAAFVAEGSPIITGQPISSRAVAVGEMLSLQVGAEGHPPLFYQWTLNGTNLAGMTNATFVMSNAQLRDAGEYSVIVSNGFGLVRSGDSRVTIFVPPQIVAQPVGQTISAGSSVTFAVIATGSPPPRYQWRLNGVNIPSATGSTLTITNAQPTDGGSYSVVVANIGGAVNSHVAELVVMSPALPFADNFNERGLISTAGGVGSASNTVATHETGETNHVGKVGGASVWLGWVAPSNGIASFGTRGSSFDTLLAVYTGSMLAKLTPVAEDEDRGAFLTSQITFNARAGIEYLIAVDGFAGASGKIVLSWNLDTGTVEFPRIRAQPLSRTVRIGDSVEFSVTVNSPTVVSYQWFFGCRAIPRATNDTLLVPNVGPNDVGNYRVVVMNASTRLAESLDALLQIGPAPEVVSQDKLEDVITNLAAGVGTASLAASTAGAILVVSPGTIDSQVLNNTTATTSQRENNHCGVLGGASMWLAIRAAGNGILQLDTIGSDIDTLMAAYTGADPLSLREVACDNNGAPDGIRSLMQFDATEGTEYWVVVDGVNGAKGTINVNWKFGNAPVITASSGPRWSRPGESMTLWVTAYSRTDDLRYQWRFNGRSIMGATMPTLNLTDIQPVDRGRYDVIVSNFAGSVTNVIGTIEFASPIEIRITKTAGYWRITGPASHGYVIESSSDLHDWHGVYTNSSMTDTALDFVHPESPTLPRSFYRVVP